MTAKITIGNRNPGHFCPNPNTERLNVEDRRGVFTFYDLLLIDYRSRMSGFGTADFFYKEAQQLGYVARSTFKVVLLVLGFRSPSFDLSDGFIGWLDQNYMAKEGRINCIRRDRYGDFLTEGFLGIRLRILWRWLWVDSC
ncbi:uncharacterized protein LOC128134080 [Lactuca sativa]|uniref:uncharacterized protein LOC128134080 n=1 Tax=Lactuca sativa TaxID=4236 RepID=UPI001C6931BE|nr:uncharacterized protein LOC128134080 [Lactuca sativa]